MAATTPKLPQNLRDIWTDMYSLHANFNDMGNTVEEWTAYWKTAVSSSLITRYTVSCCRKPRKGIQVRSPSRSLRRE